MSFANWLAIEMVMNVNYIFTSDLIVWNKLPLPQRAQYNSYALDKSALLFKNPAFDTNLQ